MLVWHFVVGQLAIPPGTFWAYFIVPLRLAWSGVDLFFVLSGFLIGGILLDNREAKNLFKVFYIRRACRIFPLYFASIALYAILSSVGADPAPRNVVNDSTLLVTFLTYTQNFVMAYRNEMGWMGVTWSLAVEEQFYLFLPLLVIGLPRRYLAWVLAALILATPIIRTLIIGDQTSSVASAVLLPCRWDALFLGVIGAMLSRSERFREATRSKPWLLFAALGLSSLGILWLIFKRATIGDAVTAHYGYTLIALFYLCVVMLLMHGPENSFKSLCRTRPLAWLGTVSYGVYLLHEGSSHLLHHLIRGQTPAMKNAGDVVITLSSVVLTLLVAGASYRWFESPLIRRGHSVKYDRARVAVTNP